LQFVISYPPENVVFDFSGFQTIFFAIWLILATDLALGMIKSNYFSYFSPGSGHFNVALIICTSGNDNEMK
jgi:hypothetical protein